MRFLTVIFAIGIAFFSLAASPSTQPTTDSALWARMVEIDSRAGTIKNLAADFEQKKFTALLKKPLVSSGKIRVAGETMRWDTEKPETNVLLISTTEVKMYYPKQKTVEVYRVDQKLGQLAASPLPTLEALKQHFTFEQIPAKSLDDSADESKFLALKLVPIEAELAKHLEQVLVLLDISNATIVKAEMTDTDGDRTAIAFRNIQANTDVGDLELHVPADTKISRPLEALEGDPSK